MTVHMLTASELYYERISRDVLDELNKDAAVGVGVGSAVYRKQLDALINDLLQHMVGPPREPFLRVARTQFGYRLPKAQRTRNLKGAA